MFPLSSDFEVYSSKPPEVFMSQNLILKNKIVQKLEHFPNQDWKVKHKYPWNTLTVLLFKIILAVQKKVITRREINKPKLGKKKTIIISKNLRRRWFLLLVLVVLVFTESKEMFLLVWVTCWPINGAQTLVHLLVTLRL